jgi:hypothetical protein
MLVVPGGVHERMNLHAAADSRASLRSKSATRSTWLSGAIELSWYAAALGLIVAFGALKIAAPVLRDSAVYLWIAQQMHAGSTLYVDVWDLKQPGIFIFYELGGSLFGFTPEGVHLFELIWQIAFAVCLIIALRTVLQHRWLASVAPVACLASYYIFCKPHQQTQVEGLVWLPMFVVAWLTSIDWRGSRQRVFGFFLAGAAAGITTAFKHVLAPIPVAFILCASVAALRRDKERWRTLLQMWLPFTLGVVLVWGAMIAVFWRLGALQPFIETNFGYPLKALGEVTQAPASRLALALMVFAAATAPWLIYAAFAVGRSSRSDEPALFGRMAVWFMTAATVILLQKSSWWPHHTLLLYPPVGVLAARGLDLLVARVHGSARRPLPAMALSALLVVPVVAALGYPAGETARGIFEHLRTGGLDQYRRATSADYAGAADAAAYLVEHAPPGSIYAFGDPNILLLSGRRQAIPVQGSAWGFYLKEHWQSLPAELTAARPVWIFLETSSRDTVAQHSPETLALLAKDYRVVWDTPYGRWYALKDAPVRQ